MNMQIDNSAVTGLALGSVIAPPMLTVSVGNIGERMKANNTRKTKRTVARITVTFQPTESSQRLLDVADQANLNRSELLNALIEKHLPSLLREQVSLIESALDSLRKV